MRRGDHVLTGSTRRRQGLGDQNWCHVTLTRSANVRTQQQAGGHTDTHAGSRIGTSASCYHASYASAVSKSRNSVCPSVCHTRAF